MEDQLSALPDETIIAILSFLTIAMKEAARTGVLSLEWKNLWKFFMDQSIPFLTSLIDASPCLYKFVVKCCKKSNYMEDQLSALPDETIIAILSFLTMKEAARTGVLSLEYQSIPFLTSLIDASPCLYKFVVKCCKKSNYMEDQLSALPDETIIAILSLLTMKEAARIGVLSLECKNLWKLFMGSLNFDASNTKACMEQEIETMSLETERTKYISWVNKVFDLHQGQNIEEFRLCFDMD
ncbi:F-box/FBD/LRR-repeat protein [Camellia lanceoleosa]|uniref:F-box/FBD/LRR-repeat protein n=1 Tax=Camellia lanceoleosa TaxID=1840588 RepID=A0ACC0G2B5_9ERIC|nr:F-box/FBD/LRR-repeat protein [Camellia lanceoleosa]